MMMDHFPIKIRLELDEMRYQVVHYLSQHHVEIEKLVEEELERVLGDVDWGGAIRAHVRSAVEQSARKAIDSYFEYGEGSRFIKDVVERAFNGLSTKKDD